MGCNKSPFTEEQKKFIKKHYKGVSVEHLIDMLESEYGIRFKKHQITHFKFENGLKAYDPLFGGEVIQYILKIYKGKSMETITAMVNEKFDTKYTVKQIKTFLQKRHLRTGYRQRTYQHGDEVMRAGYVYININGNFVKKDRYILKTAGVEVLPGSKIKHLDGDQLNCDLKNLAIISGSENLYLNTNNMNTSDREFNQCAITLAKLNSQVKEMGKDKNV